MSVVPERDRASARSVHVSVLRGCDLPTTPCALRTADGVVKGGVAWVWNHPHGKRSPHTFPQCPTHVHRRTALYALAVDGASLPPSHRGAQIVRDAAASRNGRAGQHALDVRRRDLLASIGTPSPQSSRAPPPCLAREDGRSISRPVSRPTARARAQTREATHRDATASDRARTGHASCGRRRTSVGGTASAAPAPQAASRSRSSQSAAR